MASTLKPHLLYPDAKALETDGRLLGCPFQNPVAVQNPLSTQPSIMPVHCGSWCVMFEQHNNLVKLNCVKDRAVILNTEQKVLRSV